ncbi:MAG: aspartate carbamoyltransferase catalytic subunit [Alphaproteobacteria bacterium]|nr:aspartate carbamoyltransferase catalytic subunit [Alphaproteobacteria bacterium]
MINSFSHKHLLDIERLSAADVTSIIELAGMYASQNRSDNKKSAQLAGKIVVNLFFENSTRTRTSFDIAAKRLGADVVNVPVEVSSVKKGETLLDTALTIDAMQVDAFVIRHSEAGLPEYISKHVKGSVLNAGDGTHAHPTQALLDAMTLLQCKGNLKGLNIAICGDIEHSRVARSNISLLNKFGAKVRIIAPRQFMPGDLSKLGVEAFDSMESGLVGMDAVMMLRIQHERLTSGEFSMSAEKYHKQYGLDHEKLGIAKPDAIVLHPCPINRGVEISSALADDANRCVIWKQIENGVAVRMACLDLLLR